MERKYCSKCGKPVDMNGRFCGKCGQPYPNFDTSAKLHNNPSDLKTRYCGNCGAVLGLNSKYCGKCGKICSGIDKLNESIARKSNSKLTILAVVFSIGLCLIITGIIGNILLSQTTKSIKDSIVSSMGIYDGALNYLSGGIPSASVTDMVIAIVRNDKASFFEASKKFISTADSIVDLGFSVSDMTNSFLRPFIEEEFPRIRQEVKNAAGKYWILLLFVSFSNVYIVLGLVISVVTGILIYKNGLPKEWNCPELRPAIYIGMTWGIILIVVSIGILISI